MPELFGIKTKNKILIVDDDAELRSNLSTVLEDFGYNTDEAPSGEAAIEKITSHQFDLILLDEIMPIKSGTELLGEIRKISPKTKIIMITAFATFDHAVDAIKKGATNYLSKPFKIRDLEITIKKAIEEARFDENIETLDLDFTLSSLSNQIRRGIVKMIAQNKGMRLMEMTRALGIDDHTKVVFHLKILRDAGIIEQKKKTHLLTKEGEKILGCLKILEKHLSS
jgi:DNA-binding NtrC family response regulator